MKKSLYKSADATRNKILRAARKLFAKYGYAGTAVGKIALLAKVNHSLIFHHFKNKENLWLAVKIDAVDNSKTNELPPTTLPFSLFLKKLVEGHVLFYQKNPELLRMLSWQQMEKERNKQEKLPVSESAKKWLAAIEHYQKAKAINAKLKPEHIATMILSLTSSYVLTPYPLLKEDKGEYIDFCIKQLLKSLAPA